MSRNFRAKLLSSVNNFSRAIQRKVQGIPRGPSYLYNVLVARFLKPMYVSLSDYISAEFKGKTFLDVGCGTAALIISILGRVKAYAIGLDISKAMIEIASKNVLKHKVKDHVDLIVGDAHKLPFRDNSLDFIVSTGTLHHLGNLAEFFRECCRALRKEGKALIYELSHDVSSKELKEQSARWKRPGRILELAALMHGIPRMEYVKGYVKASLEEAFVQYNVRFKGILTELVIRKPDQML